MRWAKFNNENCYILHLYSNYTHAEKKKATPSFFVYGSFYLHSNSGVTYKPSLCGRRPSHTCPANLSDCWKQFYLPARQCQHGCNMARNCCQLVMSYPLTGLLGPDPSPIDHPLDNLGWWVHYRIPPQPQPFLNWNTSWLNNAIAFHKGWVG